MSLKDLDDESTKLLKEMIDFYRVGKWAFWIFVGLGILASAITAWITVLRHIRS